MLLVRTVFALGILASAHAQVKVVLTDDDGWATAKIRATKHALDAAGFKTIISAPAVDRSGTGSSDATATVLKSPCEFNSCPAGSPAEGFNASDPSLNYVNSFPVTSVKYGIRTLAPKLLGGSPDLVISGPNDGLNTGSTVQISGTVGAASEAALEGIPSIAVSANSGVAVSADSYLTLRAGDASSTYAAVSVKIAQALVAQGKPYLPSGIALNVNLPRATGACASPAAFKFVLTRIKADAGATDVATCGTSHLPDEGTVVGRTTTCQATISVFKASGKADVDAATQAVVLGKLRSILSCA